MPLPSSSRRDLTKLMRSKDQHVRSHHSINDILSFRIESCQLEIRGAIENISPLRIFPLLETIQMSTAESPILHISGIAISQ